jgi:flagellar basal body-associated protein FliL
MNLLAKLENFVNKLLILLIEFVSKTLHKMIPQSIHAKIEKYKLYVEAKKEQLKSAPQYLKKKAASSVALVTAVSKVKDHLKETYSAAMSQYQDKKPKSALDKLKRTLMTPILMISKWLSGLSATQSLVLLTFTAASFLSGVEVIFSGKRIVNQHIEASRDPASLIEEDVAYERPDYYKKQTRHFEVNNLRLPVYIGEVNDLRSIDVDFVATVSNREARMYLEKHEFQFRDHLINEVEPMLASFPLEDEGKEILRQKLEKEINAYIKLKGLEGWVTDLKLTYILAN